MYQTQGEGLIPSLYIKGAASGYEVATVVEKSAVAADRASFICLIQKFML